MKIYKYSGSGNDFIFLDNFNQSVGLNKTKIPQWCERRSGIGADGVILISKSEKYDYKLQIFNADASEAEMCGNASRCSIHFAKNILGLGQDKYEFETMNGVYTGELVSDDEVRVKMTELYDVDSVDISDFSPKNSLFLNTGVPHAVIQVSHTDQVKIDSIGALVRRDKRFKNGTNVDFFEVVSEKDQIIKLRVYERGVEGETYCCGTGVMAGTAVACAKFFAWDGEITVHAKGGVLKAIVSKDLKDLYFQGKVELVYTGELYE